MNRSAEMLAGAMVLAAVAAGCAEKKSPAPPPAPPPPTVTSKTQEGEGTYQVQNTITATATVVSVNHKTREVTLRGPEGDVDTFRVSDDVRNFAQVHKGDHVNVTYYESIAVQVRKPGEATPGIEVAEGADRAPLGEKPAAAGVRVISVTATITDVDRKKQIVTLKGPRGRIVHVHVKDPTRLEKVKKGDLVDIKYTEALAIDVQPAKAM